MRTQKIFTVSFLCSLQLSLIQIIVHYPRKIISKELTAHLHSLAIAICKAIKEHISCYFGSIQKRTFALEINKVSATAIHVRNLEIPRLGKGGRIKIIQLITAILGESIGEDIFTKTSHTWKYATVTIPAKGPAYFSADIPNDFLYILCCD